MHAQGHWERVYKAKQPETFSWYQQHSLRSMQFIRDTGVGFAAPIIDVGGGCSTLVDDLLDVGYTNLTILDLSAAALELAAKRLGPGRSMMVQWLEADITKVELAAHGWQVWHDRAMFHFIAGKEERRRYIEAVRNALMPGGYLIIATFAEDGPRECSGLTAVRYRAESLQAEFGVSFTLLHHEKESHLTPTGSVQQFEYCCFRRIE